MAARSQHFPAVNFSTMSDGEVITVPYMSEIHYVKVSADQRVENQLANGREITYQIDELAQTITFMMVRNGNFGRVRTATPSTAKPQEPASAPAGNVTQIGTRRKKAAVAPIAAQKLTQRERMLRSFWREVYVAAVQAERTDTEANLIADNSIEDYDQMMTRRDARFVKENARG